MREARARAAEFQVDSKVMHVIAFPQSAAQDLGSRS
jgi:hypothetical protein